MGIVRFNICSSIDRDISDSIRNYVDGLSDKKIREIEQLHIDLQKRFNNQVVAFEELKATFHIMKWDDAIDLFDGKEIYDTTHLKDSLTAHQFNTEIGELYILDYIYDLLR